MALTQSQRKHLEARRDTLPQESGDLSAFHSHLADQGTDTADQELVAANAERQTAELAEIDARSSGCTSGPKNTDGASAPGSR